MDVGIEKSPEAGFDLTVHTLVIGAGACGLVAALASIEQGHEVLVVEGDAIPSGSTALSAGLIPAAGTVLQTRLGIKDSADVFFNDIQNKAHSENDPESVLTLVNRSAEVIEWLMSRYDLPFSLVDDFDYPGHSRRRMHGLPSRSGAELIDRLRSACESESVPIVCSRRALTLYRDEALTVTGVGVCTDTGEVETIGCEKLILACNGYGGSRSMVNRLLPGIANGVWFGHDGNRGDAIIWGEKLGAQLKHLAAYQGHGNVAHPHGILITWAVITQGGIQLNINGNRFWDESQGYSEAALAVLSQPEGVAVTVFDERIADIARQFEDFKQAESVGAVIRSNSLENLARKLSLPVDAVVQSVAEIPLQGADSFGREFQHQRLKPPYCAVKVTGALFHTQGGLVVDEHARVKHSNDGVFSNLYAGGGAACGVSGKGDSGYLSGNGLLSAFVLGYLAGRHQTGSS